MTQGEAAEMLFTVGWLRLLTTEQLLEEMVQMEHVDLKKIGEQAINLTRNTRLERVRWRLISLKPVIYQLGKWEQEFVTNMFHKVFTENKTTFSDKEYRYVLSTWNEANLQGLVVLPPGAV